MRRSPLRRPIAVGLHLCLAILLSVSPVPTSAHPRPQTPPDVSAVLASLDALYRSTSSIARMEIIVVTPRTTRTLRLKAWTRGDQESLVIIEAPPREEGIATLRVGENLWNYLPRIARTIRVPPTMMLGSWMGTDFTNDDLVKESSYRRDFDARIDRRSESPAGWWIRLDVKPGIVGRWSRIDLLIADDGLPVEEHHFDRKGRRARTMTFDQITVLGGRRLPTHMVMTPAETSGQRTEMRYLDAQFDVTLPADTFSLARLERRK